VGKSYTSKYALEMDGSTSSCWWVNKVPNSPFKGNGKPTAENLRKYMEAHLASLKEGGSNYHLTKALGDRAVPKWARLVLNDGSREVIAEWKLPAKT
jgi:hypothetical protein